jgi:hypothetical protein
MAPTMNMTKPVTTAIATFVSIDKFIIFPFNYGGNPRRPLFFGFCFSYIASNFGVLMVVLKAEN